MEIRHVALTLLASVAAVHASIREYPLDARTVYSIQIAPDAPTTCVFPVAPSALEGAHVSEKPDDNPAVLLSYRPGAAYFTVRAMRADAAGALNVVISDRVYVLSFAAGQEADRVVVFLDERRGGGDRSPRANPTDFQTLIARAKARARLAVQFPALRSTLAHAEPGTVTRYRDFTVTVEDVVRFDAEDALVLRLRFENHSDAAIRYEPQHLAIRVGDEIFPAGHAEGSGAILPNTATRVFVVLANGPDGRRANLPVNETFNVIVPRS